MTAALAKLAWMGVDKSAAVAALAPVARDDVHAQTRQHAIKALKARDGTVVQSEGERRIAESLTRRGLAYRYDGKFRIIGEFQSRPDFYLSELDVYIEYWGLDSPQYKMTVYKKQILYQQEGKKLVSVYPKDLPVLDRLLDAKLQLFGFNGAAAAQVRPTHPTLRP